MPRLNELLNGSRRDGAEAVPKFLASSPQPPVSDDTVCKTCHGIRFVRRDLPIDHPEFGQALPCPCVQNENAHERQARLQRYSNLGPLTRLTFENLISPGRSGNSRHQQIFVRCLEHAKEFANDPQGWIVIGGPSGSGKTHLGAAIANQCIRRGIPAFFIVVPNLLDHLRAAYRPNADVGYDQLFEQVSNAPVLILDDLGAESHTPWAEEKLFQIVNHRFNARLPTVVTTNLPLNKLNDRLRTRFGDPSTSVPHADPIASVYILEEHGPLDDWEFNMLDLARTREMTFLTFDHDDNLSSRDREWRERAFQVSLEYAREPTGWLALLGGRAKDRSHLLAAIANQRRELGPLLVRVNDLLDYLRHSMRAEGDDDYYSRKQALRSCPFLLLDELELGTGSDYARRELHDLLSWRQMARLSTVVGSPNEINDFLGDAGWARLGKLLRAPDFVNEVAVGETPQDERLETSKAARSKKRP